MLLVLPLPLSGAANHWHALGLSRRKPQFHTRRPLTAVAHGDSGEALPTILVFDFGACQTPALHKKTTFYFLRRAITAAVTPAATTATAAAATAALVVLLAVIHLNARVPRRPGGLGTMVTAV